MVIGFTLMRPSPWVVIWLFPLSHMPALVKQPELTGPLVYSGGEGVVALMLVVGLGAIWVMCGLRLNVGIQHAPPSLPKGRSLPVLVSLSAISIWTAFVWPVLDAAQADRFQAATVVLGVALLVIVLVSGQWLTQELGELSGHARHRRRWIVALLRERQPQTARLSASLSITLLGALMVLILFR